MELKLYRAGLCCYSLIGKTVGYPVSYASVDFKDVNGTTINQLFCCSEDADFAHRTFANMQIFKDTTVLASSETESNFAENSYVIDSADILNLSIVKTEVQEMFFTSYLLSITNNGQDAATINSFKFYKTIRPAGAGSNQALLFVVYLDEPIAVAAGSTEQATIKFSFLNPSAD